MDPGRTGNTRMSARMSGAAVTLWATRRSAADRSRPAQRAPAASKARAWRPAPQATSSTRHPGANPVRPADRQHDGPALVHPALQPPGDLLAAPSRPLPRERHEARAPGHLRPEPRRLFRALGVHGRRPARLPHLDLAHLEMASE